MADYPDFEGGKAKVYSVGEWAAFEGEVVSLLIYWTGRAIAAYGYEEYTVTEGKTLYVVACSLAVWATLDEDKDNFQHFYILIRDQTDAVILATIGGEGGGHYQFDLPIKVPSGNTIRLTVYNYANHTISGYGLLRGYEITED